MCVAVPVKVIELEGNDALVEMDGVRRRASMMLVDGVRAGDWVILHAGYAISVMDEKEAEKTLALLREMVSAGESGATT